MSDDKITQLIEKAQITMTKSILKLMAVALVSFVVYSCQNPLEKTEEGRRSLAFLVDGEIIKQRCFSKSLGQTAEWSMAAFKVDEFNDMLYIRALLDSPLYEEIKMGIPLSIVHANGFYQPVVTLKYVFRPAIICTYHEDDGGTRYEIKRKAEYNEANIENASLYIRSWRPFDQYPVLAGDFSFSGYYIDSLSHVVFFHAEKGTFDVSDSPHINLSNSEIDETIWDLH